ncbi:lupus La protein [Sphaerodactylus townsendi]|uniref:lupus La protein n=1 Tax=Sphaerodactylus townsendi TaxID=933632 RepID=UPI002026AB2A|nr:lupus La protein [Sphaerodactylus townsendi]XP_048340054.1 lupus La protein [Sphaerodactylus townsendi]XP_048340055.1 lupus La protein [Sphaerodactylus townsendi]XP_048340056.1 lupus La protein [Sphaerodactylus townsendi]
MAENEDHENMSDLENKVCQQIEYYFGDYNLPRDKFLQEKIKLDEGWVPLEIIIKFNRLNRLTKDFDAIVGALRKSKAGLMEVSEDNTKIRRSPTKPVPEITEKYKSAVNSRSVYIKGFPLDATLDDIKEWLENKGKVESIQMRKTFQKSFKGSIFAVFDTVESAKQFVEIPGQKYNDTELIVLFRDDYFTKKQEERKRNRLEKKAKAKQDKEEQKKQAEAAEMKSLEEMQGCLLKFSGDLEDQTSREDLHEVFFGHGEIKWIDFVRGAKEGIILFKSSAQKALSQAQEANSGDLQLRDRDVAWEVLEGEVAKEALEKIIHEQQKVLNKKERGCKGKDGRGGRGAQNRKVKFLGKKTKFDDEAGDDDEAGENNGAASAKKRPLEDAEKEGSTPKQMKTENNAGNQK